MAIFQQLLCSVAIFKQLLRSAANIQELLCSVAIVSNLWQTVRTPSVSSSSFHPNPPPAMDDRNRITKTSTVKARGTTVLEVVYTNEEHTVERILDK